MAGGIEKLVLRDPTLRCKDYLQGTNLAEDHRAFLQSKNPENIWAISLVDNIPYDRQIRLGYAFEILPKHFKEYMAEQASWVAIQKYFLGQKLGRSPTNTECLSDFETQHTATRARLTYVLLKPSCVCLRDDIDKKERDIACSFLQFSEQISGIHYGRIIAQESA